MKRRKYANETRHRDMSFSSAWVGGAVGGPRNLSFIFGAMRTSALIIFSAYLLSTSEPPITIFDPEEDFDGASKIMYRKTVNFFPLVGDKTKFFKLHQTAIMDEEKMYDNDFVEYGETLFKHSFGPRDSPEFDMEEYTYVYMSDLLTTSGSRDVAIIHVRLNDEFCRLFDQDDEVCSFYNKSWQYCSEKKKVLVCARKLAEFEFLRFVEFIPQLVNDRKVFRVETIPFQPNKQRSAPASAKKKALLKSKFFAKPRIQEIDEYDEDWH